MIVLSAVPVAAAWASLDQAVTGHVRLATFTPALILLALVIAVHLTLRWTARDADPLMLPLVALLNGLGLVMIHRLDLAFPSSRPAAPYQLAWTACAVAACIAVLVAVRDHRVLQNFTYTAAAAAIVLVMIPALLPASHSEVNGAKIWIRFFGLSFQPGELGKLLLAVFFAGYLVRARDVLILVPGATSRLGLPRLKDVGPLLLAWGLSMVVLVVETDLGTSLLFFGLFVAMLYVATGKASWLAIGLGLFAIGAVALAQLVPHVHERVTVWLHPFAYAQTTGYQLVQAVYAMAAGGLTGTGLGRGHPALVPFANSDFITSSFAEELGLVGLVGVLVLLMLLTARGLRASVSCRDGFGTLLAAGISFGLALQVFVVVGGVTRLIPLTGETLPFLAYGGSSLLVNWMAVALLLRISHSGRVAPAQRSLPPSEKLTEAVRL